VVTVSLELSGPDASRPFIEAAAAEHPSLLDPEHRLDALFGVVNVPNVIWIDEQGMIVRPPEPGWAGPAALPPTMVQQLPRMGRPGSAPKPPERRTPQMDLINSGQDRGAYPDAIHDWAENGAKSRYALSPEAVVARSQPRPMAQSEAAAHFELANHLWRVGRRDQAIAHFNECHRLQPDNWTYKRQAWSLVGNERVGGELGRFVQGPLEGEEGDWPFPSDFRSDVAQLRPGEYYPKTL
jgi:tetratricopeptide (TPR) repeat protein